jgi:hypothetical protein
MPLEVAHLKEEDMTEEDRKEQKRVFELLKHHVCICGHRKAKHEDGKYNCKVQTTYMEKDMMHGVKCTCTLFESQANLANPPNKPNELFTQPDSDDNEERRID